MSNNNNNCGVSEENTKKSKAKDRWKLLQSHVLKPRNNSSQENNSIFASSKPFSFFEVSDRIFPNKNLASLNLELYSYFKRALILEDKDYDSQINTILQEFDELKEITYTIPSSFDNPTSILSVKVCIPHQSRISLQQLMGFDNTGNICVWPSEEILAYYVLVNRELFKGATVIELAAGSSGLAGIIVGKFCNVSHVVITDGLALNIALNTTRNDSNSLKMESAHLLWGENTLAEHYQLFDSVIAADCLFLYQYHDVLFCTLAFLLKIDGSATFLVPHRGGSLQKFLDKVNQWNQTPSSILEKVNWTSSIKEELYQNIFECTVDEQYLDELWTWHQKELKDNPRYNPDSQYPLRVTLIKRRRRFSVEPLLQSRDFSGIWKLVHNPNKGNLWRSLKVVPVEYDPKQIERWADQFERLKNILAVENVDAAGVIIQLTKWTIDDLWFKLMPLCIYLSNLQSTSQSKRILIGVSGGPGSGKTVLSEVLKRTLDYIHQKSVTSVLGMDAYHFPNKYLDSHSVEINGESKVLRTLKGDPITFDVPQFLEHLQTTKEHTDTAVFLPVYDRRLHDPVPDKLVIEPSHSFVIVEGMFLLYDKCGFENVKNFMDVNLYLDVDAEICHKRLVERKVNGGRQLEDAESHYQRVDLPNILRVTECKHRADLELHMEDGVIQSVLLKTFK